MYVGIKQFLKAFIPKRTLIKYEPKFRFLLYQIYKGVNFQCNICHKKLRSFIVLEDGEKLCPFCGSLSRARRLWNIIETCFIREGIHILDFSPSRSLYRALKKTQGIYYVSTDVSGDFLSDFHYDITHINDVNDNYDLIICYHVLEHIDKDSQAIQELFRILKKGGTCLVQTPFKEGDIIEDPLIDNEQERLKHFGQKDHVRIYTVNVLKERLIKCGFQVTINHFTETETNKYGFKLKEEVLFCTK
jgi:SAM-dependent methyltransferase